MRQNHLLAQNNIQELLKQMEAAKSTSDVRVLRTKLLFVNGLVRDISDPQIIQRKQLMGQYGRIVKATVSKVKNNFYSAFVEYETEVEAALALLSLDNMLYKGKVIKVFYGSTKYCFSFLKGEQCRIRQCAFSHTYHKQYTYFKANTASIDHSKIAQSILRKQGRGLVLEIPKTSVFPTGAKTLQKAREPNEADSESEGWNEALPESEWQELDQQISSFVQSENKAESRKKTKVQEFLEYAEQKLYSMIFKATLLDEEIKC